MSPGALGVEPAEPAAVAFQGVSFKYGRRTVLHGIDLRVGQGILGLLGPNGAGKSTLLSLAATLTRPHSGSIRVLGNDVRLPTGRAKARRSIGILPQRFSLAPSMTALETVAYAAWVNGISSADCGRCAVAALSSVDLTEHASVRVRKLSGGQRQRVGIAGAIAHQPALLLLDEATAGVDPVARIQLRRYLQQISSGRTVIVSTHLVEDVVQLCERVVVLNAGRVVYNGATAALVDSVDASLSPLTSPLEAAYEQLLHTSTAP